MVDGTGSYSIARAGRCWGTLGNEEWLGLVFRRAGDGD